MNPTSFTLRPVANRQVTSSDESGFTLLELLAVVMLVSIATMFAFLNLDGMTAAGRLGAAGREIANTISWLRNEAATQAREFQIEFDLDEKRYRVIIPPRPGLLRSSQDQEDWEALEWTLLPEDVRFLDMQFTPSNPERSKEDIVTSGTRTVTFDAMGGSQSFMIHLESSDIPDRDLARFSVEANGFTGTVQAEIGHKEFGAVLEEHELK
jgi:prepilin-type N-terminal cleavage/methylation domain-containing protein